MIEYIFFNQLKFRFFSRMRDIFRILVMAACQIQRTNWFVWNTLDMPKKYLNPTSCFTLNWKKTDKTARKQNFVTRTKFVIFLSFSRIVLCEFFQFYDGLTVGAFDNMHCRTFSACFISSKNRSIATRQSTDTNKLDHFEYLVVHKHKNKSKMNVAKKERVASNIIPFSFFLLMVWHFVIFH